MKNYFKLILPTLSAVLLFSAVVFHYVLPRMENAIIDKKRKTTQELVNTVIALMATYESRVTAGLLDANEARQQALATIKSLRYGSNQKNYFWINDMQPRMIMHPYRTDLVGKNLIQFKDANGNHLFAEAVQKASQPGGGFIEYLWQQQDHPKKIAPKVSYIALFRPWGWVVGSGMYYDDVKREIAGVTRLLILAAMGALLLTTLITVFQRRQSARRSMAATGQKPDAALISTVIEQSPAGMLIADAKSNRLVHANAAALAMLGEAQDCTPAERGEKKRRSWRIFDENNILLSPRDCPLNQATREGVTTVNTRHIIEKGTGERTWIEVNAAPVRDENGNNLFGVAVFSDITQRIEAEKQNDNLQKLLQRAQKMEAIGTLAGGIAHDFNNILFILLGNAELAQIRHANGEDITKQLAEVSASGMRARDLVQQILDFSRQTEKKKQPLMIAPMIKEALKFLRASIPATIEISTELNAEKCRIFADPTNVHQLVMNLCNNAAHAMKNSGGLLQVTLDDISIETGYPGSLKVLKPNRFVRLAIRDTGHGMSPEVQEKIFDPFFTTKTQGEGTGLGLSIVHGIIKDIGGTIDVESTPGHGTTFSLHLPVFENQSAASSPDTLADMDSTI